MRAVCCLCERKSKLKRTYKNAFRNRKYESRVHKAEARAPTPRPSHTCARLQGQSKRQLHSLVCILWFVVHRSWTTRARRATPGSTAARRASSRSSCSPTSRSGWPTSSTPYGPISANHTGSWSGYADWMCSTRSLLNLILSLVRYFVSPCCWVATCSRRNGPDRV